MKKILLVLAMLSIMLVGVGNVYAVPGVMDDVPGTDVVFPIVCEKGGTMNTLWAIGDTVGGAFGTFGTPSYDATKSAKADVLVFNRRSAEVYDAKESWTAFDIQTGDCQTLVAGMSPAQAAGLELVINGKTYYVAYIAYVNLSPNLPDDRFVSWVYLVDLPKGFASGFNGFDAEGGVDLSDLDENGRSVVATDLYPRFFILNDKVDTWTWWTILKGQNSTDPANSAPNGTHKMEGTIYNEEECPISMSISIPDELTIIDVNPLLPVKCFPAYPKAGMGIFNLTSGAGAIPFIDFSTFGWAYERAQADTVQASWDVIHPMHRDAED